MVKAEPLAVPQWPRTRKLLKLKESFGGIVGAEFGQGTLWSIGGQDLEANYIAVEGDRLLKIRHGQTNSPEACRWRLLEARGLDAVSASLQSLTAFLPRYVPLSAL